MVPVGVVMLAVPFSLVGPSGSCMRADFNLSLAVVIGIIACRTRRGKRGW